jgi:hypothetical protein
VKHAVLGLSGHCNGYRATIAVICNNGVLGLPGVEKIVGIETPV